MGRKRILVTDSSGRMKTTEWLLPVRALSVEEANAICAILNNKEHSPVYYKVVDLDYIPHVYTP